VTFCSWSAQACVRDDESVMSVDDDDSSQTGEPCDSTISDPRDDSLIDGPATGGHAVAIVVIPDEPGPHTVWTAERVELTRVDTRIPTIQFAPKTSPPDRA